MGNGKDRWVEKNGKNFSPPPSSEAFEIWSQNSHRLWIIGKGVKLEVCVTTPTPFLLPGIFPMESVALLETTKVEALIPVYLTNIYQIPTMCQTPV